MPNPTNSELHVIFGTGPVGLAVMDELLNYGKQVRLVNRSGRAPVPAGVQVVAGDATDPAFTRQICHGAAVVYQCSNPPYTEWVERFPPLQAGVLAGAADAGAKLVAMENVYMYNSKFSQAFGNHATPLPAAIQATVAWWRDNVKRA